MMDPMDFKARYEFFFDSTRSHRECPHCGKEGYKFDSYDGVWGSNHWRDDFYLCASCQREWVIRTYKYSGYEKYPGPAGAVIYIPETTEANQG